jgi:DUF177 domain-containing protein
MSGPLNAWYGLRDLEALAVRAGTLGGELPISKLTRLRGMLASDVGGVRATVAFKRHRGGGLELELDYHASMELLCQRCLEPFLHAIAQRASLSLVDAGLPSIGPDSTFEPYELDEGRLNPAELIEDELIVSIPLVPKHGRIEDCGSLAGKLAGFTAGLEAADEAADR